MNDDEPAGALTFPKARRLTRPSEFLRVKMQGTTQRGAFLILGVLPQEDGSGRFRVGFVTSKRVGGAVVRNRVRRRLREIVRRHQHALCADVWLVVIARPAAAGAASHLLEKEWLRLAGRAGILRS